MAGNSEKTAKRRGPGRKFAKGQSGNPKGRPKIPTDVRDAYRAMHPRALARLKELLDSDDERVALKAAEIIIERVDGKVTQPLEHGLTKSYEQLVRESMGDAE